MCVLLCEDERPRCWVYFAALGVHVQRTVHSFQCIVQCTLQHATQSVQYVYTECEHVQHTVCSAQFVVSTWRSQCVVCSLNMKCTVCRAVGRHKNVGVSYRLACLPPPDAPGQEDDDIYWDGETDKEPKDIFNNICANFSEFEGFTPILGSTMIFIEMESDKYQTI